MKRKERYLAMFSGLGPKVRVNEFGQESVEFKSSVTWAMKRLRKDDRIVWFLSIIQRAALLRLRDGVARNHRSIERKIQRRLKGFDDNRVNADFESNFVQCWPHYESLEAVYQLGCMKNYPFYFKEGNKLIPKPAAIVLRDYQKMEERLNELAGNERFCMEGQPFLPFENGWTWFEIEGGMSGEEARAMKHCGNGAGKHGDRLLSLREPVERGEIVFWKPHLTFIINDGSLGEMKGYANNKPDSRYHPYVEGLLAHPKVEEIRGGGYLPENNFSFTDLKSGGKKRVLVANPELNFDSFGNEGQVLVENEEMRWIETRHPQFPENLPKLTGLATYWVVCQTPIETSAGTVWTSQAWCARRKGCVGPLILAQDHPLELLGPAVVALLLLPEIEQFPMGQDPLTTYSSWSKALGVEGCCELMQSKPIYFRDSSLKDIWQLVGLSEAYLSVLNYRFGLDVRKTSNGIELRRYNSPRAFARETCNQTLLQLSSQPDPDMRGKWLEEPPFEVPWLKLQTTKAMAGDRSVSLVLTSEGAVIFFEIMDFENTFDFTGIVPEIIYRFGLRRPSKEVLSQAA